MAIDRAWYSTFVDDSGGVIPDGTVFNVADLDSLHDAIDDEFTAVSATLTEANNGYVCKVYHATTQSLTHDTVTAVLFNSEDSDTHTMHDTTSNTSRITIPTGAGGTYLVQASIPFASNTTGFRLCRLKVSGSNAGTDVAIPPANGSQTVVVISTLLVLTAGQYVEVHAYQNSGGALDIGAVGSRPAQCEFMVVRVG